MSKTHWNRKIEPTKVGETTFELSPDFGGPTLICTWKKHEGLFPLVDLLEFLRRIEEPDEPTEADPEAEIKRLRDKITGICRAASVQRNVGREIQAIIREEEGAVTQGLDPKEG